jgi:hypothetical protein
MKSTPFVSKPFFVPRAQMPQIVPENYVRLIEAAQQAAITVQIQSVNFQDLHAHQKVNHVRALAMPPRVAAIPIVTSGDNFVLDGNHRWWNHRQSNNPYGAEVRIGLPFDKAVDWLNSLEFVTQTQPQHVPSPNKCSGL